MQSQVNTESTDSDGITCVNPQVSIDVQSGIVNIGNIDKVHGLVVNDDTSVRSPLVNRVVAVVAENSAHTHLFL